MHVMILSHADFLFHFICGLLKYAFQNDVSIW